jgi:hypothetical protein
VTPVKSLPDTCHCSSANDSWKLLTIDQQMGEAIMNLSIGMKRAAKIVVAVLAVCAVFDWVSPQILGG